MSTAPELTGDASEERTAVLLGGPSMLVELRFTPYERHPGTGETLIGWVRRLPGREWVPARKAWWVPAVDLEPGTLGRAGFCVRDRSGRLAYRHAPLSQRRPPEPNADASDLCVPDWFGLDLAPYQLSGALAVAAGRRLLADPPGLGKTRQCLAAAAALGARRTLVVCPPVVLPHWAHEASESGLPGHPDPGGEVVVVRSGRKQPALPAAGVVVVPDTLVAARQGLADELCDWAADVVVLDEAHRAKTWSSRRSRTARMLAASAATTIASTGTPMFAAPHELAPILEATGDLRSVFGGHARFLERYTTVNRYRAVVARKKHLGELGRILDERVWVRRNKTEVLADLPPKSRRAMYVEVDPAVYRSAHAEVLAEVDSGLDEWEKVAASEPGSWPPDDKELWQWCSGRLELVSRLRRAAGLSKVPAAAEIVSERVLAAGSAPDGGFASPLVVWTHHRAVSEAMLSAAAQALPPGPDGKPQVAAILGCTPDDRRARIIEDFSRGRLGALVASITAAGVGITLTRASEAIFVEVDWTPAVVAQAEDRIWRIGQNQPVTITTLLAEGTLDGAIQSTLARKADTLDQVMTGGDHHVAVGQGSGRATATALLVGIVAERITERPRAIPARRAGLISS